MRVAPVRPSARSARCLCARFRALCADDPPENRLARRRAEAVPVLAGRDVRIEGGREIRRLLQSLDGVERTQSRSPARVRWRRCQPEPADPRARAAPRVPCSTPTTYSAACEARRAAGCASRRAGSPCCRSIRSRAPPRPPARSSGSSRRWPSCGRRARPHLAACAARRATAATPRGR